MWFGLKGDKYFHADIDHRELVRGLHNDRVKRRQMNFRNEWREKMEMFMRYDELRAQYIAEGFTPSDAGGRARVKVCAPSYTFG